MIDESAQRVPLYILARHIYLSICISSSVVIPMSVDREAVHAKTGNLSFGRYGRFLPNSGFSID
jgi:hypothetical protein